MRNYRPDLRAKTPYVNDPDPICEHGYGYGHGCDDCAKRTWLASKGYSTWNSQDLPAYEDMPKPEWSALSVAGQRDELLALAGEFIEILEDLTDTPLPKLRERYGPWTR